MKKLLTLISITIIPLTIFSQPNWVKGGNNSLPVGSQPTIGTSAAWNSPLQLITNGQQRLYIDNNAGGVFGNIGIGSVFSATFRPFSLLHLAQDNGITTIGGGGRNWMRPGLPATYNNSGTGMMISNGDNVWLGLKHKGVWDANDAVLAWGDNGFT